MKTDQETIIYDRKIRDAETLVEKLSDDLRFALDKKEILFKEVNDLSGRFEDADKAYRYILVQFAQLLRSNKENTTQNKAIDTFLNVIKKKEDIQFIESAFLTVKNATFKTVSTKKINNSKANNNKIDTHKTATDKTDTGKINSFWEKFIKRVSRAKGTDDNQTNSFLSKFIKSDTTGNIEKTGSFLSKFLKDNTTSINSEITSLSYYKQLQDSYQDIVDELKLLFGKKYLRRLLRLGRNISNANSLKKIDSIKNNMITIFQDYIGDINTDREKATKYVVQIVKKIFNIEKYLMGSIEDAQNFETENDKFTTRLNGHLEKLKGKAQISNTFEDLKKTVDSSVTSIIAVIREKKGQDLNRKQTLDKKIASLQNTLLKMKDEIQTAKSRASQLEKEVSEDSLTGIYNRKAYENFIDKQLQRFLRYKTTFSLLIFDIDHFKNINDSYGHAVGDRCLKEIIVRVKLVLRENDFLARYGGDEFVTVLPETQKDGAVEVAEKIIDAVRKIEFLHKEKKVQITISVGVTEVQSLDTNYVMVFKRADDALYEAKNDGRDKVAYK